MRIELPMITAICYDGRPYDRAVANRYRKIIDYMTERIKFHTIRMFLNYDIAHPAVDFQKINQCGVAKYNDWCVYEVANHFTTDFALIFQADGFALNPELWSDTFLKYDYIGAPWPKSIPWNDIDRVGNGGFSLRSKPLCRFVTTLPSSTTNEDAKICIVHQDKLRAAGLKVAPVDVARTFSVENPMDADHNLLTSFGYHGAQHEESIKKLLNL